jgi:rubrerythrin
MELEVLLERLHQVNAVDRNALAIYTDLLAQVQDPEIVNVLKRLVRDETKHVKLEKELISFLEHKS